MVTEKQAMMDRLINAQLLISTAYNSSYCSEHKSIADNLSLADTLIQDSIEELEADDEL
jgi:hypothetical protein